MFTAAASAPPLARATAPCAAGVARPLACFAVRQSAVGHSRLRLPARRAVVTRAVAAPPAPSSGSISAFDDLPRSGLAGQALRFPDMLPTKAEVLSVVPQHCFVKDTCKSMGYAALSLALTLGCGLAAALLIPLREAWAPAWVAYAMVNGTLATGCWVVAHECGHNAFSNNRSLQDAVGYVLHSLLLVPYFSWQRSHAVHHAKTNHVSEGETHCPYLEDSVIGKFNLDARRVLGEPAFVALQLITHLGVGWPAYLLWGATGGSSRGVTNHFWPVAPFSEALWPGSWKDKVWRSDVGVLAVAAALVGWGVTCGWAPVLALYVGPYLICNAWLVAYTWLQHTDVDVPHYESDSWSFVKGAFHTIDRPYGPVFDFLHHRIGSTHVAHHIESAIPHYHALEATNAIKAAFPELYLYDPTPVHEALWRVAANCVAVTRRGSKYVFVPTAA